ncbi:hypothetical protein SPRG_02668 [Saprolegnia parasitica CBS 223.65]|uniref:Uncharacterized protein n=1 Tax=Saprolegnia parasitica (strain CBS 223.65) TaxID=695850 RepID=A0A067D1Q9_SAPPC|nr:hypothetical protein SPRG_02668 [Saprolegnia parasitica CBS 223.65]KDO32977.1 hypothetical protein SPRG_02668 [Saprolegnia parasitica CBS 223.65]|eukprot:XP_012196622.1 hypothetical protein SPRG_02668 [Saprolegnia parasitica CBS 223.65]
MTTTLRDAAHSMLANKRKRLLLMALITLLAVCIVVAAIVGSVSSSSSAPATSTVAADTAGGVAPTYTARPVASPTPAETTAITTTNDNSATDEEPAAGSASVGSGSASAGSGSAAVAATTSAPTTTLAPTTAPPQPRVCSASDATTACYVPPASTAYCRLDTGLDARLHYVNCPAASNANAGFAMDEACGSGMRCPYACALPFLPSSNGWSSSDCLPFTSLCPPSSPATARGGLFCANGTVVVDAPSQPLCVSGLNTSFVKSYVPQSIATCKVIAPGNGAPMVGVDTAPGHVSQLASHPQWFWRGEPAKYYTLLPGVASSVGCQRNYDRFSLNAAGIDAMPYTLGGGSLPGSPCAECAQHTLSFGEHFDSTKPYSAFPGYGVRVRNCNDAGCGDVQCDATYALNAATGLLEAYWVKYNAVFGPTSVGCIATTVVGYGWAPTDGTAKYTLYEYYPVTITGQQDVACTNCSLPSTFVPSACRGLRANTPPRFGTGYNPAVYICTPVGAAIALQNTISFLSVKPTLSDEQVSAIVIIEITAATVLGLIVVGLVARARYLQLHGAKSPAVPNADHPCPTMGDDDTPVLQTPDRRGSAVATQFHARASMTSNAPGFALE